MAIARRTQRPGQTREQTKLIAQGIQKGIDLYKKEQKTKARALDRQRHKQPGEKIPHGDVDPQKTGVIQHRQHWFPWVLLLITWTAIALYLVYIGVLN